MRCIHKSESSDCPRFRFGHAGTSCARYRANIDLNYIEIQEAQLSPSDRAVRLVSSNLANYHATVQKLLIRQVLTKPMV